MNSLSYFSLSFPNVIDQTFLEIFIVGLFLLQLLKFWLINFVDVLNLLVTFLHLEIQLGNSVSGNIHLMRQFAVLVLLLFQLLIVFFVFLCDSLNLVVLLGQNRETILLNVLDLLFKGSLYILPISLTRFGFSHQLLNLTFLFLNSLVCELLLLFYKLDSLIIFINHWIVFHRPLCIECL